MALTTAFDQAYHDLVRAWERHHHLRRAGAPFAEVLDARRALNAKRMAVARLRPSGR